MAVMAGYKKTDLGFIPQDWDVVSMGQVGECLIGLTYSPRDVRDFGTLVLRSSNVQNGRLAFDNNVFVEMEIPARAITRKNDILICVRNGSRQLIGKCALVDDKTAGSAFGAFMSVLRSDSAKFLFFQFQSNIQKRQIDEVMGATINQITNKNMAEFKVIWPPTKTEQEAIAGALSDADALIESLEQLITKKRHLKQGAMQELLTSQTRLPGFHGEWEVNTVAELEKQKLVKLSRGQVISKKDIDNTPGDFPIYSSSIHNDGLFGRYGDFMFDEELITWSVDGGGNFFHRRKHRFSVTNVCGFMRVDTSRIDYRFFAAELQLLHSRKSFDYQSKAHPSVIRKEYEVQLPSLPEQTAIAAVLTEMDAELARLEQRRDKTRALKQAMMQELLTGRIRLPCP
jgi:type I restriction enzyme S subunit